MAKFRAFMLNLDFFCTTFKSPEFQTLLVTLAVSGCVSEGVSVYRWGVVQWGVVQVQSGVLQMGIVQLGVVQMEESKWG